MTFTGFLFICAVLIIIFFGVMKILNSRTLRIALLSYRDHLQQKEIEKELQKSRQRTIEEIKNPDLVMETIMKIKRGEEVKIPLAAFDYIYRNMRNFSIVDKEGRIAIINQQDYFVFKEKALALMTRNEDETVDAKKILEDISRREAENPIEVTNYEDGTIVKIDHVSRTAEITKPNGEKIFVDHKTEQMVSQNLIEKQESAPTTKEMIQKDSIIKKKTEENLLLKGKMNRLEKDIAATHQHEQAATEEPAIETFDEDYNALMFNKTIKAEGDLGLNLVASAPEQKPNITEELGLRPKIAFKELKKISDTVAPEKREEDKIQLQKTNQTPEHKFISSLPYETVDSFLDQNIRFNNIAEYLEYLIIDPINNLLMQRISNVYTTYKSVVSMSSLDVEKLNVNTSTHDERNVTLHKSDTHSERGNNAMSRYIGVVYDKNSNCFLVNIHWLFFKIFTMVEEKSQDKFFEAYYTDTRKCFVNNSTLTKIIAHFNRKSSMAIGSKVFMQEEGENKNTINFKTVKIAHENTLWQGQYLYFFASNSVGKKLIPLFEEKTGYEKEFIIETESDKKGLKIDIETFLY